MATKLQWEREDGVTTFKVDLARQEHAFAALRDVPGLIRAASGPMIWSSLSREGSSVAYAVTGFLPISKKAKPLVVNLRSGNAGEVGAVYSCELAFDGVVSQGTMYKEIVSIVEETRRKEVVLKTTTMALGDFPSVGCLCNPSPIKDETETRLLLTENDGAWSLRLSHNGTHPCDRIETEGLGGFVLGYIFFFLILPCFIPCAPCIVADNLNSLHVCVDYQVLALKRYLETYNPELPTAQPTSFQNDDWRDAGKGDIVVALPVEGFGEQEDVRETRADELRKWHHLYKTGAISAAEYELEKEKILGSSL